MFDIFHNPWLFFWVAMILILQNIMRAFPVPDDTIENGFGSRSPGYRFLYKITQGVAGDMKAIGIDPQSLTRGMVTKNDGTPKDS